jgi:tetratricopeptide (TPR) repeat protein
VYAVVAGAAGLAALAVVAITAATHHTPPKPLAPRAGRPPFGADPTVSTALNEKVRTAMAAWPNGTVGQLRLLAREAPRSSLVHLNLGLALFWGRHDDAALAQWRTAQRVQPDTRSAIRAQDLLHPDTPRGLPFFVPSFPPPPAITRLPPAKQFAALQAAARRKDARSKLLYGIALQRQGRPVSAERQFAAAAAVAPNDVEALVAAAVGRYTKDHPELAFAHLGPLVRRYPHAQTVRFHLGLLAIWIRDFSEARKQLELARAENPHSSFGREAKTLLDSLVHVGTS